jgi:hypothetical protein
MVFDAVELAVLLPPEMRAKIEDLCRRSVPSNVPDATPPTLREVCEIAVSLTTAQRDRLLLVCKDPQMTNYYGDPLGLGALRLTYAQVVQRFPFETPLFLGQAVAMVVVFARNQEVMR